MFKIRFKRVVACVLMICIIFSLNVSFASAETDDNELDTEQAVDLEKANVTRVEEVISMREANSKTYQLSDGSYQYVGYAEDIHYADSNGDLQEIDNEITSNTGRSNYLYTNTANSWKAYFSNGISSPGSVLMVKDDYQIAFSMPNAIQTSKVAKASSKKAAAGYYKDLASDNRSVLYENVLNDVDITYTVQTNVLKEDIVLKSASAPNTFTFDVNLQNLTLVETDGDIVFRNTKGDTIFQLAPMYMEDANGKRSESVFYTVQTGAQKGEYRITLTVDSDFLNAADTVFPVIVDPSVMVTGSSTTFDTCVDQQYPTSNYYLRENLWTGGAMGTNAMRTYIKFTLPTNISASQITSAYLRIKKREHAAPTVKAYRVTSNWTSSAITWNNKPGFTTSGATGTISLDTGAWYKINVTTMVKNWRNGTYTNYGFMLKEPSETNTNQKTKFYSSDAPSPNKPELIINYNSSTPDPVKNVRLIGVTNAGHNHSSCLSSSKGFFESCDFSNVYVHTGSFTVANINSYLDTNTNAMFLSRSHGGKSRNTSGQQIGTLIQLNDASSPVKYKSELMPSSLNLSNLKVALFIGCETGAGGVGGKNLPTVAVQKGAQAAIGFRNNIGCDKANTWTIQFANYMNNGRSIKDACSAMAKQGAFVGSGLDSYIICGNGNITLK